MKKPPKTLFFLLALLVLIMIVPAHAQDVSKDGIYKDYYASGALKSVANYKNGQLEGVFKSYDEGGNLRGEGTYKNGKEHGSMKFYYRNGNLQREIGFKDGLQTLEYKFYDEEGNEIPHEKWEEYKINRSRKIVETGGDSQAVKEAEMIVNSFDAAKKRAVASVAKAALRRLSLLTENYAELNDGKYPASLQELKSSVYSFKDDYCTEGIEGFTFNCDFSVESYSITANPIATGEVSYSVKTGGIITP